MRKQHQRHMPRHSMLSLCLLAGFGGLVHAQQPTSPAPKDSGKQPQQQSEPAKGSTFNEEFLKLDGDQPHADLSLFAFGNRVLPGPYLVDVYLNQYGVGKADIRFYAKEGKRDAVPCLTRELLDKWGVLVQAFPAIAGEPSDACIDLASAIPDASVTYAADTQRLMVSIPQAALRRSARGAVDPGKWDKGVNAAMLDYQLSYARYSGSGFATPATSVQQQSAFDSASLGAQPARTEHNTFYAGFRLGANLGDWRFRQFSNYNQTVEGTGRWQAVNTYAQRDLKSINGQLLIGDGTTPGNFFDSMQFRGVQISSDDAMLPDSLQGYAPTIRGVAQTNARVTIRQNGYLIYSTFVPPGPFVIDDLYATASSGDLEVIVTEADGRQTRYTQAYAAVPTLLREGAWRYSATGGKYRNGYRGYGTGVTSYGYVQAASQSEPGFVQGTLARGMGDDYTLYGGFIGAESYQSLLAGVGKNMKDFGAVSLDLTAAHTDTSGATAQSFNGQRFAFSTPSPSWIRAPTSAWPATATRRAASAPLPRRCRCRTWRLACPSATGAARFASTCRSSSSTGAACSPPRASKATGAPAARIGWCSLATPATTGSSPTASSTTTAPTCSARPTGRSRSRFPFPWATRAPARSTP